MCLGDTYRSVHSRHEFSYVLLSSSSRYFFSGSRRLTETFCGDQKSNSRDDSNAAINGPPDLPRHEAAGQNVDALEEPDAAEEHENHAKNIQRNFHCTLIASRNPTRMGGRLRIPLARGQCQNRSMAAVPSPRSPALPTGVPMQIERVFQSALLGMLASGYFALLGTGFLDWPTAIITLAALCARGLMVAGILKIDIPSRAVAALTIAYAGFFPLDYLYVSRSILSAMVHLILFLAVVKVVTARTPRDFGYLKIIAGLELLAAAILSFQLSFFLFLALFLLSTIATFSSGEIRSSAIEYQGVVRGGMFRFPRRLGIFTVGTFLGILMVTAGAFFVLPRTARAAFQRFVPRRYHLPGFANDVTLGEIGEIKLMPAVR